jgi:hypothetical protein
MFESLAKARRAKVVNAMHNKLIRESVLDLVEDEKTGETGLDSTGIIMDVEDENIPEDVLDSVEAKVDEALAGKDLSTMTDEDIDALVDQIVSGLDKVDALN